MSRIGLLAQSLLAFGAVSVISLLAISRQLEQDRPEMALGLMPLNVDAFLNLASTRLLAGASGGELDALVARAGTLLRFNAGDARLYSLIGELEQRKGEANSAKVAYGQALALARTEIHALERVLAFDAASGRADAMLDHIDTLFRRWPERIAAYAPLIPRVFARPGPYEMLVRRIGASPPWQSTLISHLSGREETISFSARLIQDLAARQIAPRPEEISNVLNGLINMRQYELAYRTFLMTLSARQQEVMGHIHNGRFRLVPTGRPFDWQILSHPGVVFSYPATVPGTTTQGLTLEFQQAPVRDLRVRQYMRLPAGQYSLGFRVSATSVSLPKGLLWSVRCADSNVTLAQVPLKDGSYQNAEVSIDLTVPDAGCGLQSLYLSTNAVSGSWNARYGGIINFDDMTMVAISR